MPEGMERVVAGASACLISKPIRPSGRSITKSTSEVIYKTSKANKSGSNHDLLEYAESDEDFEQYPVSTSGVRKEEAEKLMRDAIQVTAPGKGFTSPQS